MYSNCWHFRVVVSKYHLKALSEPRPTDLTKRHGFSTAESQTRVDLTLFPLLAGNQELYVHSILPPGQQTVFCSDVPTWHQYVVGHKAFPEAPAVAGLHCRGAPALPAAGDPPTHGFTNTETRIHLRYDGVLLDAMARRSLRILRSDRLRVKVARRGAAKESQKQTLMQSA